MARDVDTRERVDQRWYQQVPGSATAAVFLVNEALAAVTPWKPIPWMIPYFPIKVLVGVIALVEMVLWIREVWRERASVSVLRYLVAIVVAGACAFVNFSYDGLPLAAVFGRDLFGSHGQSQPHR
jgi:hypothetical protein